MNFRHKTKLTLAVLASTVFISTPPAYAAPLVINGSDVFGCAAGTCGAVGTGGVDFQTDNKLTVITPSNIGQTTNVSVSATGGNNIGEILFQGGGSSTITGSVTATGNILRLINLDSPTVAGVSVIANANIRVTTLNFGQQAATLRLEDGVNLTANVTNSADFTGTLRLLGTHTITGNVGSTGTGLSDFILMGSPGSVVTTTGNIKSSVIFEDDNELIIADGKSITRKITTDVDGEGILTFMGSSLSGGDIGKGVEALNQVNMNGGIFTLTHDIFALTTTVASGARLVVAGSQTIDPDLVNNGRVDLGTAAIGPVALTVDTYTGGAGSELNLVVTDAGASYSTLTATGAVVIPTNGLNLVITGDTIPDGTVLSNMITSTALTVPASPIIPSTATYSFTDSVAADDLSITVNTTPMSSLTGGIPLIASVASFFDTLGPTIQADAPGLIPLYDALNAQPDAAALQDALATIVLPVNGNLLAVSHGGVTRGIQVIAERMDNNRAEFCRGETRYRCRPYKACESYPWGEDVHRLPTGYPKYSMHSGQWIEFYGSMLRQDDQDISGSGYNANEWGLVAGYDKALYPSLNTGAALSYSHTRVSSHGVINNQLGADSFQGFLYASHEQCNGIYWDGIVSLAYNDYNQSRWINVPAVGPNLGVVETASANFGGWQVNTYLESGYQWRCHSQNFVVIPHLIFKTTYLRTNSFAEEGAPLSGFMNVQYDEMEEVELGAGFKVAKNYICYKKYRLTPYFKIVALHDFVNDPQQATANFIGGGPPLVSTGAVLGENTVITSVGLTLNRKDNTYLTLEYDYEVKRDFHMHAGFLKYRVEWY